jgi:hypothetical protein
LNNLEAVLETIQAARTETSLLASCALSNTPFSPRSDTVFRKRTRAEARDYITALQKLRGFAQKSSEKSLSAAWRGQIDMAFEDAVLLQLRSLAYPNHFTASVAAPGLDTGMHYTLLMFCYRRYLGRNLKLPLATS